MSITYKTIEGDTFELIARKQYGVGDVDNGIARANPGVTDPPPAGTSLIIPDLPEAPTDAPQETPADDLDETAVVIEATRFRFWNTIALTSALDNFDTIQMTAPWEPDREEFRETFRPFSYRKLLATIGGSPHFTGVMVSPVPTVSPDSSTLAVSGYSTPAVLGECTMPASAYPLEFNDQSLRQIAGTLARPFGIKAEFETSPGAVFDRVALEPGRNILPFLAGLAKERGLVIGSTPKGALIFRKPGGEGPLVARLSEGESPVVSIAPTFSPQEYYSHVTAIAPSFFGLGGESYTRSNRRLSGVLRPHVYQPGDLVNADLSGAVDAKLGRMFGNAVTYSVEVATWRDPQGDLWRPNTRLTLDAPGAMIYSDYEFLVRTVALKRTKTKKTATLGLVLPGSFSGKIPESMPWDG